MFLKKSVFYLGKTIDFGGSAAAKSSKFSKFRYFFIIFKISAILCIFLKFLGNSWKICFFLPEESFGEAVEGAKGPPCGFGVPPSLGRAGVGAHCRLGFWRDFQEKHQFRLRGVANLGNPVCSLQ